ncbi:hypothetical protein TSOC_010817 [Tetrabaena socialis]|uniref:Uncharacterized protein n=1 Tax=Tetrabaena socialis TaxID=47790 RepID=A0A2J7ZSE3_9CHLO|nr:hypothetical protein TSOC_010817 [Tetrabaena socialis]|eukprot:PNH03160.1 hypothetical protein TSOC_010817 [Tetrabaena socialis]
MDYYYTTGDTQLFRRDLSSHEERAVQDNPRVHTGKGYYTKPQ